MRICSIASGSSGNCIYVGSDATHILIDAGISGKRIEAGVRELGLSMGDIDAVLISHEHSDHVSGLGVLARKYEIPVFCTKGTGEEIKKMSSLGRVDEALLNYIAADEKFIIKDINVNPLSISHDAAEPVAYKITHGTKKIACVTDLGYYNDYIVDNLLGLDALLIESNHDVRMLQTGPYPYPLKQRILGNRGHLSNDACGRLLSIILHDGMKGVFLGHLSKENNMPELAYETVRLEITMDETHHRGEDFNINVAPRDSLSEVLEF